MRLPEPGPVGCRPHLPLLPEWALQAKALRDLARSRTSPGVSWPLHPTIAAAGSGQVVTAILLSGRLAIRFTLIPFIFTPTSKGQSLSKGILFKNSANQRESELFCSRAQWQRGRTSPLRSARSTAGTNRGRFTLASTWGTRSEGGGSRLGGDLQPDCRKPGTSEPA